MIERRQAIVVQVHPSVGEDVAFDAGQHREGL